MIVDITILDDAGRKFVGSAELQPTSRSVRKPHELGKDRKPKSQERDDRPGLPSHILALRDKGFFAKPKTAAEVHAELQATYHCEPNRVQMALLRLQRRKELRKASKTVERKVQVAYVW